MTALRCPACKTEGVKGRLRLDKDNDNIHRTPIYKCKVCGKRYFIVNHKLVRV
jgi:uncharacterized protein YbaR (Trm112 family)